jgi:hypothetical protein
MSFSLKSISVALASLATLTLPLCAQAPRQGGVLPQAPHLQPVNVWQQYYLQQAILQQNALNQYALQQWQLQNSFLYPALPLQPNVIAPLNLQQHNAMLYTIQQLQQENAMLYGWLQQQAMQQMQQRQGQQPAQQQPAN